MNQLREWNGKCQRCGASSDIHTMSMFDVALICFECVARERAHPRYAQAQEAEAKAVSEGNTNFKGIGYSDPDLANDPVDW